MELLLIASCVAILVLVVAVYRLHQKLDAMSESIGKEIMVSRIMEEQRINYLLENVSGSRIDIIDHIEKRAEPRETPIL